MTDTTTYTTVYVCGEDFDGLQDSGFITICGWRGPNNNDNEECDRDVILNDLRDKDLCQIHGGWVPFVEVTEDVSKCDQGVCCQPPVNVADTRRDTMSDVIFAVKHITENKRAELIPDLDAANPRDRDANGPATQMYFWRQRHQLGDEHCYQTPNDVIVDLQRQYNPHLFGDLDTDDVYDFDDVPEELCETILSTDIPGVFKEVYVYEHGAFAFSFGQFSCPFDSGLLGFLHITPETIRNNSWTWEQAEARALAELREYQQYVNGEVYLLVLYEDDQQKDAIGDIYASEPGSCPTDEELDDILFNLLGDVTESETAAIQSMLWETS